MTGRTVKTAVFLAALLTAAVLTASPAASADEDAAPPEWGIGFRAGTYGVPDWVLDQLFEEHPSVDGSIVGAELRWYGENGPQGLFSVGLTLDVGQAEGTGIWQETSRSTPVAGGGTIDIAASTVTLYWDYWAWRSIHPYVGLGAGLGWAKGSYVEENEDVTVKEFIPVIHIPVGLAFDLGETFRLAFEGRVIDGWSWGGLFQIRF